MARKKVLKWYLLWSGTWAQVRVMAEAEGWTMCRRKGAMPFVDQSKKLYDEPYNDFPREYYDDFAGSSYSDEQHRLDRLTEEFHAQ